MPIKLTFDQAKQKTLEKWQKVYDLLHLLHLHQPIDRTLRTQIRSECALCTFYEKNCNPCLAYTQKLCVCVIPSGIEKEEDYPLYWQVRRAIESGNPNVKKLTEQLIAKINALEVPL